MKDETNKMFSQLILAWEPSLSGQCLVFKYEESTNNISANLIKIGFEIRMLFINKVFIKACHSHHFEYIYNQKKTIEGYLDSVPSLTFNT